MKRDNTLTALKESIRRWEKMAAAGIFTSGECALCNRFNEFDEGDLCRRPDGEACPVMARTGEALCYGTPFMEDSDGWIGRELDFLKSLLPTEEQWRAAPRPYSGYQVSSLGRVVGKRGRVLAPSLTYQGFRVTTLVRDDGSRRAVLLGRLIAEAFLGRPRGTRHMQLRRLNGQADDDRVENLKWAPTGGNRRRGKKTYWLRSREPWLSKTARYLLEDRDLGLVRTAAALGVPVYTLWKKAKKNGWKLRPRGPGPRAGIDQKNVATLRQHGES